MNLPLMTREQIQSSDLGQICIPDSTHITDTREMRDIANALSKEYTQMVQENPEYTFEMRHDPVDRQIVIRWKRRT